MGFFFAKQPNGRYCRFSSVVDCLTDINLPRTNYEPLPFQEVIDRFIPINMPTRQFNDLLKEIGYSGPVVEKTPLDRYHEPDMDFDVRDFIEQRKMAMSKAREKYNTLKKSGEMPSYFDKFKLHPTPLRAIRIFCIECQGGSRRGPRSCDSRECPLWGFRMGKLPEGRGKRHE